MGYGASCGKCGHDFGFVTQQERADWLDVHNPDHHDFVSFFNPAMDVWPRVQQAIEAATVSRADVLVNLPSCHRKNCQQDHGDIDLVFRMFAKQIAESIHKELLCRAISDPDLGDERP